MASERFEYVLAINEERLAARTLYMLPIECASDVSILQYTHIREPIAMNYLHACAIVDDLERGE